MAIYGNTTAVRRLGKVGTEWGHGWFLSARNKQQWLSKISAKPLF
jgi:hypothetical protein